MIGTLTQNEKGEIQETPALYQPSEEVRQVTSLVKEDYSVGYEIQHRPFREFNGLNFLSRMDADQKVFNIYTEPKSQTPEESWRWNGVRPLTRNKIILMAAHLTASLLYPNVFAQNEFDEEDKDATLAMKYMMEWNIRNSEYETSFLLGVVSAFVNPVSYLQSDYSENFQIIREQNEKGEVIEKEILDDILSGFHALTVPPDEILISNAYEFYLQRQRFLIRKRFIDYQEVESLYGEHEHYQYIRRGIQSLYSDETGMFYEQKDETLDTLAEEIVYLNRTEDLEIPFVNGIYLGDSNTKNNPMKHRDNENRPKYPYAKFGCEPIDEGRFYFYMSMAQKMADDQELGDQVVRLFVDGTFLEVIPPIGTTGGEAIGSDVMFPGQVTNFGREGSVQSIGTGRNFNAATKVLDLVKESANESSQSDIRGGRQEKGVETAYEVARLEENARIAIGIIGKNIARGVRDFGELMIDDIIHHQTVAEAEEILGGQTRAKFRTFLLSDQVEGGKKVTRKIEFTRDFAGREMTDKERLEESFNLIKEEGGLDSDTRIYKVNPELFAKRRYKVIVAPDQLLPKSEMFDWIRKKEAYDRAILNPFANKEAVSRDFLFEPIAPGESDKYMLKEEERPTGEIQPPVKGKGTPMVEQLGQKKLSPLIPA